MTRQEDNSKNQPTPFQGDVDVSQFYEHCNRRPLLNEVKEAIFASVSVLTILGEEGSGKTMLCRMLEEELAGRYLVVFYGSAVESFEDVIRQVALKVGITVETEIKREEVGDLLAQIQERLKQGDKKLLIIFDQAEKIFLATLERIRKMLDILNENGLYFQAVFAGENSLQVNLGQLSLCSFQGATERTYSLQPISEEETFGYLNFCVPNADVHENFFTREDAAQIFAVSSGNFAKINDEANKIVPDSQPIVVIPFSFEGVANKGKKIKRPKVLLPRLLERFGTSPLVGVVVLILMFVAFWANNNNSDLVDRGDERKAADKNREADLPKEWQLLNPVNGVRQGEGSYSKGKEDEVPKNGVQVNKGVKRAEVVGRVPTAVAKTSVGQKQIEPEKKIISTNKIETQPFIVISSESSRFVSGASEVSLDSTKKESVDRLYAERAAATKTWFVNVDEGLYTVQLMVLTAELAEENVKQILARQEYQDIANKLFIMRSAGPPLSVYVFYGEFKSKVSAQVARNSFPMFLRKNDPYITPVKDVIEKVRVVGGF